MLKHTLLFACFSFFLGKGLLVSQEALWELTLNESRITEMERVPDEQNYFCQGSSNHDYWIISF